MGSISWALACELSITIYFTLRQDFSLYALVSAGILHVHLVNEWRHSLGLGF